MFGIPIVPLNSTCEVEAKLRLPSGLVYGLRSSLVSYNPDIYQHPQVGGLYISDMYIKLTKIGKVWSVYYKQSLTASWILFNTYTKPAGSIDYRSYISVYMTNSYGGSIEISLNEPWTSVVAGNFYGTGVTSTFFASLIR
jgi:hypothetical protein